MSSPKTGPISIRSTWLEALALPVTLAALTVCWLAMWVRWLMAVGGFSSAPRVPEWVMLAAVVAGAWVTRRALATARSNLELRRAQRTIGLAGLAAVVAILWLTFGSHFPLGYAMHLTEWGRLVSPEALALGVAVLLWWRGIRIGRNEDLHETAQREFFGGTLALAVLFVAHKLAPLLSTGEIFWPTLLFFGLGLGAMAVAGLEGERRRQKESSGGRVSANRHWLMTVGAIIGLILVGGVAVAGITIPETLVVVTGALDAVGVVVLTIVGFSLYYLVALLLPILEAVARRLLPLLEALTGLQSLPSLSLPFTPEDVDALAQQVARTPPFRVLEIAILLVLVGALFWLAVRRFRLLNQAGEANEDRESILTAGLVWSQLRALFARRGRAAALELAAYVPLHGPADDPRLAVRRAYQAMLAWAGARRLPRSPGQTPQAYAGWLSGRLPAAKDPLHSLTRAYLQARYGETIAPEEARRAQTAIEQLQAIRLE